MNWQANLQRMLRSFRVWSVVAGILMSLLAWFHLLGYVPIGAFDAMDRLMQDQRAKWQTPVSNADVLIVDIDEKSLAREGRWTWPRLKLADLVERIVDQGGAKVMAFDLVFAEPLPGEDEAFAEAIRNRPVVLGYYFSSDEGGRRIGELPPPLLPVSALVDQGLRAYTWDGYGANMPMLVEVAHSSGFYNAVVDPDGVVRSLPLLSAHRGQLYESLVVSVLRTWADGAPVSLNAHALKVGGASIPIAENLSARVPFAGAAGPAAKRFRYVSATDVLRGEVDPGIFRGKIVLVGSSAQGISDRRATPVLANTPGVELHATLIAGAMNGGIDVKPWHGQVATAVLTLATGVLLAIWLPTLTAPAIAAVTVASLIALYALNFVAWAGLGWVLPVAATLALVMTIATLNLAIGHFVEGKARRAVIELFGQYVSPELVRRMARRPKAYPIESQNKSLTILFADVRGFTRIAESMDPQALREYLNRFLTRMTEVVHRHEGTVDKYMGDAIMAFWGAPIDDPQQEDHALDAAMEMLRAVAALNEEFAQRGWPPLAIGIGINSGTARVGDMGSSLRRTYTAIGDAVNLAARFEALTKRFQLPILVGETTARGVTRTELDALGETDVPGRNERVRVFSPRVLVAKASERALETTA
ncbi:MAG: CHASE2 domain-containing protein [Lautropia sp.]